MQGLINSYIATKKLFDLELNRILKEDEKFAQEYPHATKLLESKNIRRRYLIQHAAAAYNLIKQLYPDIDTILPDVPGADQRDPDPVEMEELSAEKLKEIYGAH